jgi:hypothetical protein
MAFGCPSDLASTDRKNDLFIQEALSASPLKYCRLLKRIIRGREVFYVQLVLEGFPPPKRIHRTGAFRCQPTPIGRVGLDIGTSTITNVDHRKIQRDLYSAFLLMNSHDTHAHADRNRCLRTFEAFVSLHDQEIQRIIESERMLPSSMGI